MSQYGPPGGPYPGQPQDPWHQGGSSQDPYGQADPYGGGQQQQQPYGGGDGYNQPGGYQAGSGYNDYNQGQNEYPPTGYNQGGDDQWGPPPAAPPAPLRKKRSGPLVLIVVILAVLLCGGAGAGIYYVATKSDNKTNAGGTKPTNGPTGQATGNATTGAPSAQPSQTSAKPGSAIQSAQAGDCFINTGTSKKPVMQKTDCSTKNSFTVLKRIDSTTDVTKCKGVDGYTHDFFFDSPDNTKDFVLCLKLN
jgi:hypothetical protein